MSVTNNIPQKAKAHIFLVENLEVGFRGEFRDSGRFQVSKLSQTLCSNQKKKKEKILQLKRGSPSPTQSLVQKACVPDILKGKRD